MTGTAPAAVIETVLQSHRGADPGITTNAIMQALKAHHLRIVPDTSATIVYCPTHPSVKEPCRMPHDVEGRP